MGFFRPIYAFYHCCYANYGSWLGLSDSNDIFQIISVTTIFRYLKFSLNPYAIKIPPSQTTEKQEIDRNSTDLGT